MNTAVVVGSGPETALLLDRRFSWPQNLWLFRPDFAVATDANRHLAVLDLINPKRMLSRLSVSNVRRIAMIGTFQLDNAELQGGQSYRRLIARVGKPGNVSDGIKTHIYEEYRRQFDFPPVKTILPILFADNDVCIHPAHSLLHEALAQPLSTTGCMISELNGESFAVFGTNERGSHLCACISIEKLERLHRERHVKRFFFDRNRTIIVDRHGLIAYASDNELTLQSFDGTY